MLSILSKFHNLLIEMNKIRVKHDKKTAFIFTLSRISHSIINKFCYFIALPIAFIILIIRPIIKIKFIQLMGMHVGHYLLNTELMLCSIKKGEYKNDKSLTLYYHEPVDLSSYKGQFFLSRKYPICNKYLYKMWKRTIPIIPFSQITFCVNKILCMVLSDKYRLDPQRKYEHFRGCIDHDGLLREVKPSLSFTNPELIRGQALLKQMGVPSTSKYVCLLVRDCQYDQARYINDVENQTSFRNANIDNYKKAALFLANNGYYVIRMGSKVKKTFNTHHPMIIDYANSQFRSDFMDIYLSAYCDFYISSGSGIDSAACVFRKPILFTDLFLLYHIFHYPTVFFIFKRFLNKKSNQFIGINELFKKLHKIEYYSTWKMLLNHDIELIDNSEDEIFEATKEMLLFMQNNWKEESEYIGLQESLSCILNKYGHYISSASHTVKCAKSFLLANKILVDNCILQ